MMTEQQIVELLNRTMSNARETRLDHMQDWLRYMTMTQGPCQSVHWDNIATPDAPDYLKLPEGL